jgi:hypothetical protein
VTSLFWGRQLALFPILATSVGDLKELRAFMKITIAILRVGVLKQVCCVLVFITVALMDF